MVRASGYRPDVQPHVLMLARGDAVPLTGGILSMRLRIRQRYTIVEKSVRPSRERWQVICTDYDYQGQRI